MRTIISALNVASLLPMRAFVHSCREVRGPKPMLTQLHRQQGGHQLDTVPQVLQPDVLVGGVLVVVVVGDWRDDRRHAECAFDDVCRYGAANGRQLDGGSAGTFKDANDLL